MLLFVLRYEQIIENKYQQFFHRNTLVILKKSVHKENNVKTA